VARPAAVTSGLALIGIPAREALRAGLMAAPIGEFSFIIAQLGVEAVVVPGRFYPLAVGVSLLTTLAAPFLTRHSDAIAGRILARQPKWLGDWAGYYQDWLQRLRRQKSRSRLWQLSRKRLFQIAGEMLFVSGLLVFSGEIFAAAAGWLGWGTRLSSGAEIGFWIALTLVSLAPVVAIWRNCSALSLMVAQVSTAGHPRARQLAPVIETGLKAFAAVVLAVWLLAVIPAEDTARWLILSSAIIAVVAILFLRQKLIYWHCLMEVELKSVMDTSEHKMTATTAPWLQPHADWNLHMIDCTLPDLADCQGKTIAGIELRARFGCSVVGVERQGFMIPLPPPEAVLYPRDKVLLLGTTEQVRLARAFLGTVSGAPVSDSLFEEVRMEAVKVPDDSRVEGRTLEDLAPARDHGVQIAGIHRGGVRILNPGGRETVRRGDELLVLGAPVPIVEFKAWLAEPAGPSPDAAD